MITPFATLTMGQSSHRDIMPLLKEYLPEMLTTHIGLLDGLSEQQILQQYAVGVDEEQVIAHLSDGTPITLAASAVICGLQQKINWLEQQGCETILLLCSGMLHQLSASSAMLLEPDRIVPPLIEGIVGEHQVGIIVPTVEQISRQGGKWQRLARRPFLAAAGAKRSEASHLSVTGRQLVEKGAEVVVLDDMGYYAYHRDLLQNELGIPVLLSNSLVARLAAELVA
jgi:protein AroM